MKKLILIGTMVGIASLAQAVVIPTSYNITGLPDTISGPDAYIFKTLATLDPTLNYSGATLTFSSVKLTATGGDNTLNFDLLNGSGTSYNAQTIVDNLIIDPQAESQDYFQHHSPYSTHSDVIGAGGQVFTLNQTITQLTETFSTAAFNDLISDITTLGYFDIGLDPNCTYNVGTVTLTFTTTKNNVGSVPDQAGTLSLLGLSFVGLLAFRRKLCLN